MNVQIILLIIALCLLILEMEVNGADCTTIIDCVNNEMCVENKCECVGGFIRVSEKCLPIKEYGQQCHHDIQCNDSRMICTNDHDPQQKTFCYCDPYHLWNPIANECSDIVNISQTAGNFREIHNVTGLLEKSAQKVFLGIVVAGLISVCILLSFVGICSVYGCCVKYKKGRYGENSTKKNTINEVALIGLPSGTYEAIETDFSAVAV